MNEQQPAIRPTLAVWMLNQHMNDTQLAAAAGVSVDTVRAARAGRRVSIETARALCTALGIKLEWVVDLNYPPDEEHE